MLILYPSNFCIWLIKLACRFSLDGPFQQSTTLFLLIPPVSCCLSFLPGASSGPPVQHCPETQSWDSRLFFESGGF